jgi:hypothetical protein
MRRGIPARPTRNIGKKVRLAPTTMIASCHLPNRSRSIAPVSLGNQWYTPAKKPKIEPANSV